MRQADYHDRDAIRAAFAGIDRLLLMPTPTPGPEARVAETLPVTQAAAGAGVKRIVYPGAAEVEGLDFPPLSAHTRVFEGIEAGVPATHLRHGIYAEVIAGEVAGAVAAGELAALVGDARVAPVLRSDLAAAIATVLLDDAEAEARLVAAGLPAAFIPSMLGFYAAYHAGWPGTPSGDIERLAGRPATPTLQAIAAILDGTAK